MNNLLKQDQDKLKLFKRFGYDIPKTRKEVVLKAKLSGRILEVGTGKGHLAVALAQKGLKVISIDMDRKAQQVARENLKMLRLDKQVTLKIMNAERLAYKNSFFDGVISVNFLHHARNPLKCIEEMVRVTKNILVLVDLNKKGARIMDKVHALEGHSHPRSGVPFKNLGILLKNARMQVKTYRNTCETVLIARKGE
ncbi:MAG: class I SAM-dependent methyltransferase [Candidatus Omnitrophota bacterium]|jgi:ubiquinone/menaquinone biosynthesis C-methylase UbiE